MLRVEICLLTSTGLDINTARTIPGTCNIDYLRRRCGLRTFAGTDEEDDEDNCRADSGTVQHEYRIDHE